VREESLGETRRAVLEAATDEFAREGYVGANMDRISKRSGYAKGTLYNHFKHKRGLMLALIDEIAKAHLAYITERLLQEVDAEQRLVRFFEAGFAFVTTYQSQAQLMVNNLYGPRAEFKAAMYRAYQPMFKLVGEKIIGHGMGQGKFRRVDPAVMAGLVMNVYLGTASQVDEMGKPRLPPGEVADFAYRALREEAPSAGLR
jgi:AcrR family transcriptional regulator